MTVSQKPRVVLIAGQPGPLAEVLAELFATRGWRVLAAGGQALSSPAIDKSFVVNLALGEDIDTLCQQLHGELASGLHALVYLSAAAGPAKLLETSLDDWEQVLAANLTGSALLARGMFPALEQAKGAVVNVASLEVVPGGAAAAASRGGLGALTRAMAIDYAPAGLRANLVLAGAPGVAAEELATAIYFLADSEQSASINGQTLKVDQGASAHLAIE